MDELTQSRLIVLAVVGAIAAAWVIANRSAKRHEKRFAELGQSLGVRVDRESEFLSRFLVDVNGRVFEVTRQHIGRIGWLLVTTTELSGVSALHSADVRPRASRKKASPASADDFVVRDQGYPLRKGWLTAATAHSLRMFYDTELPLGPLYVEEGKLIHRSPSSFGLLDGPSLQDLLSRQGALASQLERSL
ncbi:MAG TPA: hypothetical protein VNI54_01335 [Thermoanaerobaculia bacterium]|nr:hypothetical protein [Thermoanaerobaculia bacterium]